MNDLLVTRLSAQGGLVTAIEAHSCGYRQPHAISHVSALVVLGLPLLNITADLVHLTLTGPGRPRTLRGLRVHAELPDSVARQRDGDRAVHPAMAIVQSAALAGITAGVAAADAALHTGQVSREDLEIALRIGRLGPGRPWSTRSGARTRYGCSDIRWCG